MDYSKELGFLTIDHGLNYSSNGQQTEIENKIMDISPLDDFFDLDWASQFFHQSNQLCCFNEFEDVENFSNHFNLPRLDEEDVGVVDQNPLKIVVPESGFGSACVKKGKEEEEEKKRKEKKKEKEKEKEKKEIQEMPLPMPLVLLPSSNRTNNGFSRVLGFDEIKKHFEVPIAEAAKEMKVGLTFLKRRCRELKIMRWPHRKLQSLKLLINNAKEFGLENEVAKLENHKMMLERVPGIDLSDTTKKLRQACFKAKYKRKKRDA